MKIDGKPFRTIWPKKDDLRIIQIIDQRYLPHRLVIEDLRRVDDMARAIKDRHLRGAPLIGVAGGFGMYLAALEASAGKSFDAYLKKAASLRGGTMVFAP